MKSIRVKQDNSFMSENVAIYYLLIIKYWIKHKFAVCKVWALESERPGF